MACVSPMREPTHEEHIGGTAAHVGDCYVWAEIYYLDSPTDYREYLPTHHLHPAPPASPLLMLDEVTPIPPAAGISFAVGISAGMIFFTIALALKLL